MISVIDFIHEVSSSFLLLELRSLSFFLRLQMGIAEMNHVAVVTAVY